MIWARTRLTPAAAVMIVAALTAAGGWMIVRSVADAGRTPAVHVPVEPATSGMTVSRAVDEFAIAPDGLRLAFSAVDRDGTRRLWVRSTMVADEQPLPDTNGAAYPFWSSDSRFIAYFAHGALRRIAADGRMMAVVSTAATASSGAWHGASMLFGAERLHHVPADGGPAASVTELRDGERAHAWPVFLPDGKRFLYTVILAGGEPRVHLGSLESTESREVLSNAARVALADGYIVFIRHHALHVQPFDVETLTPRGDAIQVSDGAPSRLDGDGVRAFSLATNGMLVYQRGPAAMSMTGEGAVARPVTLVDWRSTVQR